MSKVLELEYTINLDRENCTEEEFNKVVNDINDILNKIKDYDFIMLEIVFTKIKSYIGTPRILRIKVYGKGDKYYMFYKMWHPGMYHNGNYYLDWEICEGEYFKHSKKEVLDIIKNKIITAFEY